MSLLGDTQFSLAKTLFENIPLVLISNDTNGFKIIIKG